MRFEALFLLLLYTSKIYPQQYGSMIDNRDGRKYKTVKIGDQVWMAENLNTDKFRNGNSISNIKNFLVWEDNNLNNPAWDYQSSNPSNGLKFGKLYNWYAVTDPRGLCPVGWHVPHLMEFNNLIEFLGGENEAGKKINIAGGWNALLGGTVLGMMEGGDLGVCGAFWSETEHDEQSAIELTLWSSNTKNIFDIEISTESKNNGLSVRCIKDEISVSQSKEIKVPLSKYLYSNKEKEKIDNEPQQSQKNNLKDEKTGSPRKESIKDDGILALPTQKAGNEMKSAEEDDDFNKIFSKVEIEPQYPGGLSAWTRYLNRNLRYPQEAIDNTIQGTVTVQFIVDKEGNTSDVQAVNGPNELREEAVRVIRKSGKWTPAVLNGRQVKSYKKQPIVFRLETEG